MKEPKPDLYVKDIDGNYHRYEQEQGEPVAWYDPSDGAIIKAAVFKDSEPPKGWKPLGFVDTSPYVPTGRQQRKPLTLEQLREHWQVARVLDMTDAEIDFADYVLIARDVEALYGIKE